MTEPLSSAWIACFREWFGLSKHEARLLTALFQAGGELMQPHELAEAAEVSEGAIRMHVYSVRAAMRPEALDCERLQGYRLTEAGLDECFDAAHEMISELSVEPTWLEP